MIAPVIMLSALIFLAGCSRDYAPESSASGEQIYQAVCMECHKPATNGSIFILKAKNANAAFIAEKVHGGSLLMPSFPKMNANDLSKISAYALENTDLVWE